MPAIYAHDRFGAKVARRLDGDLKEIVTKYYPQFQIGLQGPDLFFFYKAYTNNAVVRYGNHLHKISALPFFRHGLQVVAERGRDSREYAYLLGFVCHFILDSECHPYVAQMIEETGVQHLEVEEEFEKTLLRLDHRDPVGFPTAELVPVDEVTARAICPFYHDKITEEIVLRSLKDLRRIKRLFCAPGAVKQGVINTVMKLTGKYPYVKGLMNQRVDNPKCEKSNYGLLLRFDQAIDLAVRMIGSLDESFTEGTKLEERFDRTFE